VCYALLSWLPASAGAQQPAAADAASVVQREAFAERLTALTVWLNAKATASAAGVVAKVDPLLADPVFTNALARRQLIAKVGPDRLTAFAREEQSNRDFLSWLLRHEEAVRLLILGATPLANAQRRDNLWTIDISALEIWNRIFSADPESRAGIYLRLAIATGLSPPGTGNRGAGQAKTPADPVERYLHYKTAHEKKELFPSFDCLSVWEYRQIMASNASNADLAWAREAINTWRPDLRANEQVVNSTSEVWRRFSPFPFEDTFKNVLAGGGKCGPRSSWSVFVCQAFGIPAVGVRQPGHACAAYRAAYPHVEPQPGNVWKVVYGRGWHVSKSCGLSGSDFVAAMEARADATTFSRVEHLHWLASALESDEKATALRARADRIARAALKTATRDARGIGDETPGGKKKEEPWQPVPGVIHVEAEAFDKATGIVIHDCYLGGQQVYSPKYGTGWGTPPRIEYVVDVPTTGTYALGLRAAVVNFEQSVDVAVGAGKPVSIKVPNSRGLWAKTPAIELRLATGQQRVTLTRPASQRGLALRYMEFRLKE